MQHSVSRMEQCASSTVKSSGVGRSAACRAAQTSPKRRGGLAHHPFCYFALKQCSSMAGPFPDSRRAAPLPVQPMPGYPCQIFCPLPGEQGSFLLSDMHLPLRSSRICLVFILMLLMMLTAQACRSLPVYDILPKAGPWKLCKTGSFDPPPSKGSYSQSLCCRLILMSRRCSG